MRLYWGFDLIWIFKKFCENIRVSRGTKLHSLSSKHRRQTPRQVRTNGPRPSMISHCIWARTVSTTACQLWRCRWLESSPCRANVSWIRGSWTRTIFLVAHSWPGIEACLPPTEFPYVTFRLRLTTGLTESMFPEQVGLGQTELSSWYRILFPGKPFVRSGCALSE